MVSDADAKTGAAFFTKFFTPDGSGYYCGGSLVGARHVLTRAGCGVEVWETCSASAARTCFPGVEVKVAGVTTHPHYAAVGDVYDVAVVTIADASSEQTYLVAGVVPARMNGWRWTEGAGSPRPTEFLVAGYGAVSADAAATGSMSLKVGTQPLTPWATCAAFTGRVPNPVAPAAQVCTNVGAAASVTLCERDMGGPLFKVYEYGGASVYQLFLGWRATGCRRWGVWRASIACPTCARGWRRCGSGCGVSCTGGTSSEEGPRWIGLGWDGDGGMRW